MRSRKIRHGRPSDRSRASASRPFAEEGLIEGLFGVVLPWLADLVDKHREADTEEVRRQRAEQDSKRRAAPLPLPFRPTQFDEQPVLPRDKSLVLCGPRGVIEWLI